MKRTKIATYYGRLKVAQDAPPEVIRAAYKVLVQKYHPDRHQGSLRHEIVLTALNKAQEVLLDPARRAGHDQWIRAEEIRLGLRDPGPDEQPTLRERWDGLWAGMREEGMPFEEAWRMHFTRRQRMGVIAAGTVLMALLLVGLLAVLWPEQNDVLVRLSARGR
ncbi:MAG TPA: J domain-containing protein [Methylibium sp.]|uniref:J domain-containing protein n=1 Tax=Methylibium sp. TaxID=2067992 RepID=UPI002DBDA04E|nr:J domain-containing protein [Methylibium sp.]HEU4460895.1 J domain-containing protein [Methylibium sp.]